ncbi:MAG: BamA/TamA family outer membrane protein [Chthonomonadales bacterium]|nr:BamA/TamA family outer membrane protein [Chthonomonadales bacterium]
MNTVGGALYLMKYQLPRMGITILGVMAAIGWTASAALGQGADPVIAAITVKGNTNLNSETVIASSGLKVGETVNQQKLDEAKRRLLATQLFGANRVDDPEEAVKIVAVVTAAGAEVTIEVEENDIVKGINITGTGPVPAKVIRDLMQTKEGLVLNLAILRADATAIQEYYRSKGYLAIVSGDLSMPNGILEIPIVVAKVDEVKITGLHKTRPWVVTREMRLRKGEYYNATVFERDYYRIFNTNLFGDVSPAIVPKTPGLVDITLNLEEKRTGNVSVFLGYSSRNSLVGGAEIVESNLMGRGQGISLRWDTGGLANRNSFELGFTEPWLDSRNTSLSASIYDKTVYRFAQSLSGTGGTPTGGRDDYYEMHRGAQITLSRPFRDVYRGSIGLRFDDVNLPTLNLSPSDAAALQKGPIMVASGRVTHNTRDLDLDPSSGGFEVYSLDIGMADLKPVVAGSGSSPVTGTVNFQKLQVDARRYLSLGGPRKNAKDRRNVLAFRLSGGIVGGTAPFFEQFFVGGAETLRGYREDRFWGKQMILASAELRAPLAQSLTGVLFLDAGDAWGGPYSGVRFSNLVQHDGFNLAVGFGLGLRVVTPIGPIRIDQGFGSEGARTHFSIGHVF